MTIVIVEDEAATREGLARLIKKIDAPYHVIGEADNGVNGMIMIKNYRPDVVITDIRMPKINGLEMIENAISCSPNTRYLVLSGYAEFEYAKKAVRLPVIDYLLKPITAKQLADALEHIYVLLEPKKQNSQEFDTQTLPSIVEHLIDVIKNNYSQKLYLDEFANELKVSPEYLGSLFSKSTGKSFSNYLRDVRMEHAKELLQNTDYKIYEIAFKTGYSDPKYFCRVFKEYTGISAKSFARNGLSTK